MGQDPPGAEGEDPTRTEEERQAPHEVVVVTASRREQPLGEATTLVTVVTAEDLQSSPSLVLDDELRQVPGFSLFRRSSSLVAHPTTQGVSLRGIGPSGAGRSLVLLDGLPLNDPFGGWVYWNRLPMVALDRVEISRGAASQLYGSSALGGAIQLIPRRPESNTFLLRGQLGNVETYNLEAFASHRLREWSYLVSGRWFDTGGFPLVREELRGSVDVPARSEFQTFFGRVYRGSFHAGVNLYREDRNNGTRLQQNSSRIALFEVGLEQPRWLANAFVQSTLLQSTFSRILPDRSAEFLTAEQEFASLGAGGSWVWRGSGRLLVGCDWRYARWDEQDQNLVGVFVQQLVPLHPRLDLLLGGRVDFWENRSLQAAFSPRAGWLIRTMAWLNLRGSVYRGFRAPTLNELYRPFRVGNILTLGNDTLGEERLWGAEWGADFFPSSSVLLRVNGFWNWLRDPVSNVTLSVQPGLILRQRQNLGGAYIQGLEADTTLRLHPSWKFMAAFLLSDARVEETHLRLPQVPRYQATTGLIYTGPLSLTAQGRWMSAQFEDDLNQWSLGSFVVFDLSLRRRITEHFDLFFAVENLLDRSYAVGRTPLETLGTPRLWHGGLQLRVGD